MHKFGFSGSQEHWSVDDSLFAPLLEVTESMIDLFNKDAYLGKPCDEALSANVGLDCLDKFLIHFLQSALQCLKLGNSELDALSLPTEEGGACLVDGRGHH